MFYTDRKVRPCTILGYTLTTFPKKLNTNERTTNSTELRAEGPCRFIVTYILQYELSIGMKFSNLGHDLLFRGMT